MKITPHRKRLLREEAMDLFDFLQTDTENGQTGEKLVAVGAGNILWEGEQ